MDDTNIIAKHGEALDIVGRVTDKAKEALETFVKLMQARAEAAKPRGHQIGPGKWSVLTLHRNLHRSKRYPNARPYSHPRRERRFAIIKQAEQGML